MRNLPVVLLAAFALICGTASELLAANPIQELMIEFEKGGNIMYALLLLSVFGLAFTLERALRLRRDRFVPRGLADRCRELWKQGKFDEINKVCEANDSSLGRAIKAIVHFRHATISDVRLVAGDVGTREMSPHLRRVLPLAVVATLSPLLGLFGTVIGMIGAFNNFKLLGETGDPTIFAGDISKAMITTAGGLVIAVPALALYHYFKTRASTFGDELESELSALTTEWFVKNEA